MVTSGIRIGTPTVTSRKMGLAEMEILARLMLSVLKAPNDENIILGARKGVGELCDAFPLGENRQPV